MLRTLFNPLKNQSGVGPLVIAVGINLVLFTVALVSLKISQVNQREAVGAAKNLQLEEVNKNSVTLFNKLLNSGMITKNPAGRWEPSVGTPNSLWSSLKSTGSTTNLGQIKVNLCSPNFYTNTNTQELSNCHPQSSIVTVAQELSDGKLKLNLSSENGKQRANLTVLTQFSPQSCVESTDNSIQTFSSVWGLGQGRGTLIYQANEVIRAKSLPYPEFSMALNYANPWMMLRSRNGVEDLATLKQTCNVFGYRDYVSSTCDSGHTGCNFSSPSDNTLLQYNNTTQKWGAVSAGTRVNTTYLYTITCQGKKLCYGSPTTTTVDCRSSGAIVDNTVSPSYTGSAGKDLWNRYLEIQKSGILPSSKIPAWCLWGTAGCSIGNVLHNDNTSHLIACQMLGYSAINTRTSNYFRSTGDNGTLNWVSSAKRFEMWPGATSNTYVGQFSCKGKLQQVCYDKPDWIFK